MVVAAVTKISFNFTTVSLFFGVWVLFVNQMKREPTANIPKNVKRIAPNSGESKNCQVLFCSADVIAS